MQILSGNINKRLLTFVNGMLQLHSSTASSCHHCDHILQSTDAGSGVGVTKIEVKYGDIEMSRIYSWTHMNRIHRAPHRTKRSEAFQRCCRWSLGWWQALHWEYYQPTDLISEEELKTLTAEEMKDLEAEVVKRNAWRVAQDVVSRIDDDWWLYEGLCYQS